MEVQGRHQEEEEGGKVEGLQVHPLEEACRWEG
jgi:hypothetical protein